MKKLTRMINKLACRLGAHHWRASRNPQMESQVCCNCGRRRGWLI